MSHQALPRVTYQLIDITVDPRKRTVHGYTELYVKPKNPSSNQIGLHIHHCMSISSVSINGQPAPFRMVDRQQPSSTIPSSSLSPQQAADIVSDIYQELSQDIEQSSDVFIDLPRIALLEGGGGGGSSEEHVVKISYAVTAPTDGILFWQDYAVTDNAGRRTSAWVPCVDDPLSNSTRFILRLTVPSHSMAIGPGTLEKQAWATKDKSWKMFQYMVGIPTSPSCLLFVIGPFTRVETDDDRLLLLVAPGKNEDGEEEGKEEVEGSEQTKNQQQRAVMKTTINHFLPSEQTYNNETVDQTVQFFRLPFMLFEKILETEYPLANMQQVFVPPELLPTSTIVGLGIQVLSTDSLINIHAIEQSTAARRSISMALARQWFGVFVKPAAHDDAWLVEGLAGWLEDQYFKKYAGKNELQYRRWAEREAICAADNGDAAPLIWVAERDTMPCPSEQLNPSDLRGLKCAAVVGMLERKAGEELFHRRVLALLTKSSSEGGDQQQHGSGTGGSSDGLFSAPVGDDFIVNLAKDGAFTKEAGAFKNRWVLECGVPHLVGAFMYHKRSSTLELALHQSGCEAARRAVDEAPESGVLRVLIKESVAPVEQTINIGSDAYLVNMIKVNPEIAKVPGRRGGRRKKLDPEAEAAAAAQRAAEQAAAQLPVQWVRLDPKGEWLSSTRMLQPEVMWSNQLHHSRDVIAQSEAVFGLSERRVNEVRRNPLIILEKALENAHMYCRVRADAATALGRIISDEGKPEGLDILLKYYRSRYWDGVFKPVAHSDPSEFIVAQAVIMAISKCKLKNSRSPTDAALFIMGYLDQWFSQGGYYDASELLATLCAGAGHLKLDADMDVVTDDIADRLLKLLESDIALPSPGHCVGRACLGALVSLIVRCACSREQSSKIAATVRLCCETKGLPLRLAAFNGYFQLLSDGVAVLKGALDISRRDDMSPALLIGIWQEAAQVCGSSSSGKGGGGVEGVVIDRLVKEVMMGMNVRIRHLFYMAVQRVGGKPPTLVFRARIRSEKPIIKVMVPKEEGGEEKEKEGGGDGDDKAPVGTKFKIKL